MGTSQRTNYSLSNASVIESPTQSIHDFNTALPQSPGQAASSATNLRSSVEFSLPPRQPPIVVDFSTLRMRRALDRLLRYSYNGFGTEEDEDIKKLSPEERILEHERRMTQEIGPETVRKANEKKEEQKQKEEMIQAQRKRAQVEREEKRMKRIKGKGQRLRHEVAVLRDEAVAYLQPGSLYKQVKDRRNRGFIIIKSLGILERNRHVDRVLENAHYSFRNTRFQASVNTKSK
jgi:hypothetical protein